MNRFRGIMVIAVAVISLSATELLAQNLVVNGSMTSPDGEFVVAPGWTAITRPFPVNSPDVNDDMGALNTTSGYEWTGGAPQPSPDGGSWQNVFWIESFTQTINGLIPGATYYFSYYYCTQGIRERSSNTSYIRLASPLVTVTGASGYSDPVNTSALYSWNMHTRTLVATSSSITLTFSGTIESYLAYDGIYLATVPQNLPSISDEPETITACVNGNVNFHVNATNASAYQWQQNQGSGWYDIADNATFSGTQTTTLSISNAPASLNNFRYQCVVKNSCCRVTTKPATLSVTTPAAPAISISTPSADICHGPVLTFTAQPFNGGNNPVYQWFVNGSPAGNNSAVFTSSAIADQDIISCRLTSNSGCKTAATATSNTITMKIRPTYIPNVSITASANNICKGTQVIFTAAGTNEGSLPEFIWTKNGQVVGNASPEYIDSDLTDNDQIQCTLYSSELCLTNYSVASNRISMKVKPGGALKATIIADNTEPCEGSVVTFTASSNYIGPSLMFLWKRNGEPAGTNSATYSYKPSAEGDQIICTVSANDACLTNTAATSNVIIPVIHPLPTPSLDKNNTLCAGSTRTLDAGDYHSFLWNNGSVSRTMVVRHTGKYYVRVIDKYGCQNADTVVISSILDLPKGYLPPDTSKCTYGLIELSPSGSYKKYQWSTSSTDRSIKVKDPGLYWLEVTDQNNCTGRDSVEIRRKECKAGFYAPNAFTPNGDGKNDHFRPVVEGNVLRYSFKIFNRWGQLVFAASDPFSGWNGTVNGLHADPNAYSWTCTYQLEDFPLETRQGAVLLIR